MAHLGLASLELAGAGLLEALCCPRVCFQFRHGDSCRVRMISKRVSSVQEKKRYGIGSPKHLPDKMNEAGLLRGKPGREKT